MLVKISKMFVTAAANQLRTMDGAVHILDAKSLCSPAHARKGRISRRTGVVASAERLRRTNDFADAAQRVQRSRAVRATVCSAFERIVEQRRK